jgi:hypothetical protein
MRIPWSLNEHLKFEILFANFSSGQNDCFNITSLGWSTSALQMLCTLVMEFPNVTGRSLGRDFLSYGTKSDTSVRC